MRILPNLLTSNAEKIADDFKIIKQFIDYYISSASFKDYSVERRLAENLVIEKDYDKILKQYSDKRLENFRGDVRSMPLIKPIIRLLIGEKSKSPFNYYVKVSNSDAHSKYLDGLAEKIILRNQQGFINGLNEMGVETGIPTKPIPEISQIESSYKRGYKDSRAIAGEELLEYAKDVLSIQDTLYQAYKKDWLITGHAYIFPDLVKDEVKFYVERPENVYVEYSNKSLMAEDGAVVVRRMIWNLNDLVSRFNLELKSKKIDNKSAYQWLNDLIVDKNSSINSSLANLNFRILDGETFTKDDYINKIGNNYHTAYTTGNIEVFYVAFKALKKYQILTYISEFGEILEMEVSEEYKLNNKSGVTKISWDSYSNEKKFEVVQNNLNSDLFLEEVYTNEVWHGYKVPCNTTMIKSAVEDEKYSLFLGLEPHKVQRTELNNNAECKLPIIGRCDGVSIPKELEDYQYKYNLVCLMEERTLAKDKGKPLMFPIELIPDIPQWGNDASQRLETMMYYADVLNVIFFNGADDRINVLAQTLKSVDMSTIATMSNFIELKKSIKDDAWDVIGLNRNRWGDTYASEGKGNNEQNIFRSSLHTADMNITFNKIEQNLLLTYLDYAKVAYIKGKTITKFPKLDNYILSDESRAIYELDVEQYIESTFNVSIQTSDNEVDKLKAIQSLLGAYAQNGIAPEAIVGAMATTNPHKAMDYLKKAEEIKNQRDAAAQKSQQDAAAQMTQMKQQTIQEQTALEKELFHAKLKSQELIVQMQEETKRMGLGTEDYANNELDNINLKNRALNITEANNNATLNLKQQELQQKKKIEMLKINKLTKGTK